MILPLKTSILNPVAYAICPNNYEELTSQTIMLEKAVAKQVQ